MSVQQLLVTRIGRRSVGWTTARLEEIAAMPQLFPLAQPFPHLAATAFMRGRLITVVDTASLIGEAKEDTTGGLLLRMAPPASHLAFAVPSIEGVFPFHELELREENAEGIWAGIHPWEDTWVSVIRPEAAALELSREMAMAIRNSTTGREHAS